MGPHQWVRTGKHKEESFFSGPRGLMNSSAAGAARQNGSTDTGANPSDRRDRESRPFSLKNDGAGPFVPFRSFHRNQEFKMDSGSVSMV